jgi:hypothetical protein
MSNLISQDLPVNLSDKPVLRLKFPPNKVQPVQPVAQPALSGKERKAAYDAANQAAKRERQRDRQHKNMMGVRAWLLRTYPKCFQPFGSPKLPLKINIHRDIHARHDCRAFNFDLRNALVDYAAGATYLRAMITGAVRVDLDGNPAGDVTEEAAKFAADALAKLEAAS